MKNEIDILGTIYKIEYKEVDEYERLERNEAITNTNDKTIIISKRERPKEYEHKIIRHEIIHAYLYESGLSCNSNNTEYGWAENEEMVDWFAIQSSKIFTTFKELGIVDFIL
jgi:hypothetical protein